MLRKILHYLNLDSETEKYDKIHAAIEKEIIFKGTNLWILIFAIIVASVGLNMNSTAVIIGAMLISPLMGPINGMGYSIATYNFPLLGKAVKNFSFAVIASLLASTAYFGISPISTAHSELLARTSPSIYDVMIALFGGLAGILAISSKQKGNVIPGVAIATALMPPLCTAGYGLATAQLSFFFGAIFLFTINTVFIAFSSVIISQILKFPIRTLVDAAQKKRVNTWISAIIIITVIPSFYFGYGLVQKERFIENAAKFTSNVSLFQGNYLLRYDIKPSERSISLIYGGSSLTEAQKELIQTKAKDFNLDDAEVIIKQGLSFIDMKSEISEKEKLKGEINRLTQLIIELQQKQDSLNNLRQLGKQLLSEIKTLYPQINSSSYSETTIYRDEKNGSTKVSIVSLSSSKRLSSSDKTKIDNWFKARLNADSVLIFLNVQK
ncbi:MAG TPA: DUF389 domain-containing protein [Ignavibacteriales bacterium]|nr:DUF389 domain-containing protein [Ignavibacteriales bacterium]